ncbi:hypothetical protein LINGRAHAP2_LOCUS30170 [Linum grandiflorum]
MGPVLRLGSLGVLLMCGWWLGRRGGCCTCQHVSGAREGISGKG